MAKRQSIFPKIKNCVEVEEAVKIIVKAEVATATCGNIPFINITGPKIVPPPIPKNPAPKPTRKEAKGKRIVFKLVYLRSSFFFLFL